MTCAREEGVDEMADSDEREAESKKQEVVFTPLPHGKKIAEMSREELLAFASSLVEETKRQNGQSSA